MLGETVIRIRRSTTPDKYGNDVPGAAVETLIEGALFAPGGTQEPAEVGRASSTSSPQVFFPRQQPDIKRTDQIKVRGRVYEVQGEPAYWASAYASTLGGMVVELKKVDG